MKRILLVSPEYGLGKGGIQTWAYYINQLLLDNGREVSSYGVRECSVGKLCALFVDSFRSDIFILMTWKMLITVFPCLFLRKQVIVFIHGNDILNLSSVQLIILKFLIRKRNIRFVANSNNIADIFEAQFHKKVDLISYPCIDTNVNVEDEVTVEEENIFFTITRLVKRKNIENVIKALKLISDEGVDFQYFIGGVGEERQKLERLVETLKMENKIFLLGRISEEEKAIFFLKSSLFLLPSIYDKENGSVEGYGIVFVEANCFGTPVISGNTGGMKEAVIDEVTGYHTDGSVEDIHRAIKKSIRKGFQSKEIKEFAAKHDYRSQMHLLSFIENI